MRELIWLVPVLPFVGVAVYLLWALRRNGDAPVRAAQPRVEPGTANANGRDRGIEPVAARIRLADQPGHQPQAAAQQVEHRALPFAAIRFHVESIHSKRRIGAQRHAAFIVQQDHRDAVRAGDDLFVLQQGIAGSGIAPLARDRLDTDDSTGELERAHGVVCPARDR